MITLRFPIEQTLGQLLRVTTKEMLINWLEKNSSLPAHNWVAFVTPDWAILSWYYYYLLQFSGISIAYNLSGAWDHEWLSYITWRANIAQRHDYYNLRVNCQCWMLIQTYSCNGYYERLNKGWQVMSWRWWHFQHSLWQDDRWFPHPRWWMTVMLKQGDYDVTTNYQIMRNYPRKPNLTSTIFLNVLNFKIKYFFLLNTETRPLLYIPLLNIHSPYIQFPPFITGRHGCKETFCSNYLQLSFSSIRQEPSRPCKLKEIISRLYYVCPAPTIHSVFLEKRAFTIWIIFIKSSGNQLNGGPGTWQQSKTDFQLRRQIWLLAISSVRVMSSVVKDSHTRV